MFNIYLKIILRFFIKNRIFSFINIFGLTIGLTASILILQYVFYELSYDQYLTNYEQVYRIKQDRYDKGVLSTEWANGCGSVGLAMKNRFPEVEAYVRLYDVGEILVRYKEKSFKESKLYFSTNGFFDVFPYKITKGSKEGLLTNPNHVIITESIAKKYFGDEDPVGKMIKINTRTEFKIEAVVEDQPQNTHFKFNFLISWATFDILYDFVVNDDNAWYWDGFYNYIKLHPSTDPKILESKIPALVEDKWGETMKKYNTSSTFYFIPLKDIHLYSNYKGEMEKSGNGKATYFLMFISIFLIIIAWFNYINLSTARSIERAKEVGLKKVVGATKYSLIRQFLFESSIMNLIAIVLAGILVWTFSPAFTLLTGKDVNINFLFKNEVWYIAILSYIIGTIIASLYPSIILSSYKPLTVLKGNFKNSKKGSAFRKVLVVLQFIISFILVCGTLIIFSQISYLKTQDKNFDNSNTLVLKGPIAQDSTYSNKYSAFRNDLYLKAEVENVAASNSIPGRNPGSNAGGVRLAGASETDQNQYRIMDVGYEYFDLYKHKINSGRFFSKDFGKDHENILMNETGMKLIGFNSADSLLNQRVTFWGNTYNVIGIIKDYNHEILKKSHEPIIFRLVPNTRSYYSIRFNKETNTLSLINEVNDIWSKHFSDRPFEYFFADEYYNRQYSDDKQYGIIFGMFSILAILIACLGLFGLASYSCIQRTKEIGIRKVLGASVYKIIQIFSLEYLKLMLIAIIIGLPICYYVMDKWLQNFEYHINFKWWMMILPGIILLIITLLTISTNAIKSGNTNPVGSLKYE